MVKNLVFKRLLNTEVMIMHNIRHPNIMHLHDFYETDNNYYLVIDYCNKGDLESYLRRNKIAFLGEREALGVLKQIMNGFIELRKYKVMHRDIKLSNIFSHDDRIVIGDFGLAKAGTEMSGTRLGTPLTMAPELIEGVASYSSKTDLWSIGILLYQLLFGVLPFFGLSLSEVYAEIKANSGDNLSFPICNPVSKKTQALLMSLLQMDPSKRLSWNDFFHSDIFFGKRLKCSYLSADSLMSIESCERDNSSSNNLYAKNSISVTLSLTKSDKAKLRNFSQDKFRPQTSKPQIKTAVRKPIKSRERLEPKRVTTSHRKEKSTILVSEVIQALGTEEIALENLYRYCHELNKVSFLIKTCRRAVEFAINNISLASELTCLLQSIVALYHLGNSRCVKLYDSLLRRDNIYGLHEFEELFRSDHFEKLIDQYSRTQLKIRRFKRCMIEHEDLSLLLEDHGLLYLLSVIMLEREAIDLLGRGSRGLYNTLKLRIQDGPNLDRELLVISTFVALAFRLKEMFPYWFGEDKFKWENFAVNYENMDNFKLLRIIRLSVDSDYN